MPRDRPSRDLGRALLDADDVLDRPRDEPHLVGPAKPVPLAQVPGELPFERAPREDVEIGVDGFVGDPHRWRCRIPLRQPARNLLGRPTSSEEGEDRPAQAGLDRQLPKLARPVGPALGPVVGWHRPIREEGGVMAGEFARQRTRSAVQCPPGGPEAIPGGQHATQLLALHEAQVSISGHVQLLDSWIDQDTSVALGP